MSKIYKKYTNHCLSFHGVTTSSNSLYDSPLWDVNFTLDQGALLLVRLEREHHHLPFADLAQGLLDPIEGKVEFLGTDWCDMGLDYAGKRRSKIGRVFERYGWLNNIGVGQNITLSQFYHTEKDIYEIEAEASNLAKYFGLPGLLINPPFQARQGDLRLSALVRAFLGRPLLILLERPTRNLFPEIMHPLINAVRTAREHGTAIVWLTSENGVWEDENLNATYKYTVYGSRMNVLSLKD
jgi:phospholipid/cholesterol/gamma-HCH transport system ATP-binding protein